MLALQLVLESAQFQVYRTLEVDERMLIGDCVAGLVTELGFPPVDSGGTPVAYQLRVVSQQFPLSNEQRFVDVGLAPQTNVTLESAMATYATQPMMAIAPNPTQGTIRAAGRMHRRTLLGVSIVSLFALSGLGAGLGAYLLPRLVKNHASGTTTLTSPTSSHTTAVFVPHTATVRLRFTGHHQTVLVSSWSPDGQLLASGGADAQVLIWQIGTGTVQQRLAHPAQVNALAWSPESERIATGAANQVAFFTVRTGALLASVLQQHTAPVTALAWTGQNQQQVVSGALDRRAIVWNTADYSPQTIFTKHAAPIEGISWAADGQTIASCSQGGIVRVWDAQSGRERHAPFQVGQEPLRALAFSPTDPILAVGGADGTTRLFENGLLCHTVNATNNGQVCQDASVQLRGPTMSALRSLAWSPDGRFLASGNSKGVCTLWSADALQPLFSFTIAPGQPVHSLSWSPDGDEIATAHGTDVTIFSLRP
jgi:WD40 repeat protein